MRELVEEDLQCHFRPKTSPKDRSLATLPNNTTSSETQCAACTSCSNYKEILRFHTKPFYAHFAPDFRNFFDWEALFSFPPQLSPCWWPSSEAVGHWPCYCSEEERNTLGWGSRRTSSKGKPETQSWGMEGSLFSLVLVNYIIFITVTQCLPRGRGREPRVVCREVKDKGKDGWGQSALCNHREQLCTMVMHTRPFSCPCENLPIL